MVSLWGPSENKHRETKMPPINVIFFTLIFFLRTVSSFSYKIHGNAEEYTGSRTSVGMPVGSRPRCSRRPWGAGHERSCRAWGLPGAPPARAAPQSLVNRGTQKRREDWTAAPVRLGLTPQTRTHVTGTPRQSRVLRGRGGGLPGEPALGQDIENKVSGND